MRDLFGECRMESEIADEARSDSNPDLPDESEEVNFVNFYESRFIYVDIGV